MKHDPFGKTGFSVSILGFGSAPIGYLNTERQQATMLLNLMLDSGVNLIDTAASYPGSEELIAEAIGHRRDSFCIVSKCGGKLPDLPDAAWSAELIRKTVDRSLARLKTDRLDVMLLHSCDLNTLKSGGVIEALVAEREAGKIRFVGYSGDNDAAAYAAALPDIAVIETSINLADQANIDGVLPACRKNQVGVLVKRPIANAAWKDLSQQRGLYKSYAKTYTERLAAMKIKPEDVGLESGAWPELAMRFTLSFPEVSSAIIGTTSEANARLNLQLVEKGPLPQEAVAKIREAFRQADAEGTWTGQT